MMQQPYCMVLDNRITVNGRMVYEAQCSGFSDFAKSAFKHLGISYPKFYKMDKLCKLGFLAAEYLFTENAGCHPEASTAIVLGNASGSLDSDMNHYAHIRDKDHYLPSPSVFVYTLPNIVIGEIAIRHHIKGETAFFICRDSDDETMACYAKSLLDNQIAGSCLYGWVDYLNGQYLAKLGWMDRRL